MTCPSRHSQRRFRWDDRRVLHTAWIRLSGLMQEAKLTTVPNQRRSIKLEIDTKPPKGAVLIKSILNRHMVFAPQYHGLPSLKAGKIHVLITRPLTKGRDWYDLWWYRSQRPPIEPNLIFLQNALRQMQEKPVDATQWRGRLLDKLPTIDERRMKDDVRAFLERPEDPGWMTRTHFRVASHRRTMNRWS